MTKVLSFTFLLVILLFWSSACSSKQASNSILGTWEGSPGLTVPGMMLNSTYSYDSFTFYEDIIVFRSEFDEEIAFTYSFADSDTIVLTDVLANNVGTLKFTQDDSESLALTLVYANEPDEVYKSSPLTKIAETKIEKVTVQESILGSWRGTPGNEEVEIEFVAGTMFIHSDEEVELFHYEFQEPHRLIIRSLIDDYYYVNESEDNSNLLEIRMPNENTLFLWIIDEIQNIDNQSELVAEDVFVLQRESSPPPTFSRPEDEVLYPFTKMIRNAVILIVKATLLFLLNLLFVVTFLKD